MSHDKWRERQLEMISGEKWMIDGNHTSSLFFLNVSATLIKRENLLLWIYTISLKGHPFSF
jgi:hypothetical protein